MCDATMPSEIVEFRCGEYGRCVGVDGEKPSDCPPAATNTGMFGL